MSTQILPAYFTTTRTVRKCMTGKPKTAAQRKHEKFVETVTRGKKSSKDEKNKAFLSQYRDTMVVDRSTYVSNGMVGTKDSCSKKGVMHNMHKESKEVQEEILKKAARTAPGWNKSGYMYITDGMDPKTLGRKV